MLKEFEEWLVPTMFHLAKVFIRCVKKVWLEDYEACSLLCLAIAHFFVSHRLGRFRQSSEEQSNLASLTSFPQSLTSLAATEAFVPLSTSLVAIPFLIFWHWLFLAATSLSSANNAKVQSEENKIWHKRVKPQIWLNFFHYKIL